MSLRVLLSLHSLPIEPVGRRTVRLKLSIPRQIFFTEDEGVEGVRVGDVHVVFLWHTLVLGDASI